jgi:hypothetical protein
VIARLAEQRRPGQPRPGRHAHRPRPLPLRTCAPTRSPTPSDSRSCTPCVRTLADPAHRRRQVRPQPQQPIGRAVRATLRTLTITPWPSHEQ